MHEDNLLSAARKTLRSAHDDSHHGHPIRPNLVRRLKPTGLDQIWVADITYVRLAEDFVYLAVVIDAFSRKVVGWALANHLEASLALQALDQNGVIGAFECSSQPPSFRCCDDRLNPPNTRAPTMSSGWRRGKSPSV